MSTYTAHPQNEAQEAAVCAILEALNVPYEAEPAEDETSFLLRSETNRTRLLDAMANKGQGSRTITLDEI